MEVTSAVRTIGFLHSQTHSSHVESLNTRAFFISPRIRERRMVHVLCDHNPNHFTNGGRIITTPATTSTTAETYGAAAESLSVSDVEKIKQRCLTWQWKGQYSINYFVSSDADSPQHPPLLLVHGFGASIPHWRRENLRNILSSVYGNKESVDEELVGIIREPANDPGALDAFVSIVTGPPGPNPVQLMPKISLPVLLLWGDQDPFTPLDGPVGKYFSSLPSQQENVKLFVLEGVGHCPHDDRPELVHEKLLPWLANLSNS